MSDLARRLIYTLGQKKAKQWHSEVRIQHKWSWQWWQCWVKDHQMWGRCHVLSCPSPGWTGHIALPHCPRPCWPTGPGQDVPLKSPEIEQERALLHALKTRSTHRVQVNSLWPFSYEGIRTKLLLDSLPQGQSPAFIVTEEQSFSCFLLFSLGFFCFSPFLQ